MVYWDWIKKKIALSVQSVAGLFLSKILYFPAPCTA